MSDEINKAILAKRTDEGKVERIHPETTADQVKYTNEKTVKQRLDELHDTNNNFESRFEANMLKFAAIDAKFEEQDTTIDEINNILDATEQDIADKIAEVKQNIADAEQELRDDIIAVDEAATAERNRIEGVLNTANLAIESAKSDIIQVEEAIATHTANIATIRQDISDLEYDIETDITNIRNSLNETKELITTEMTEKINTDISALEDKIAQYKSSMDTMRETIEETEQAIDDRVTAARQSISDLEDEVTAFKTNVNTTYATKKEREDGDALVMTKLTTEYTNTEDLAATYATQSLVSQTSEEILNEVSQNYVNNATGDTYATKAALKITADKLDLEASKIATVTEDLADYKETNDEAVDNVLTKLTTEYTATADFSVAPDQIASTVQEAINTTKSYADGKVAQEVIDRNSAITQSASAIETMVAETYVTSEAAENTYATQTSLKQTSDKLEVEATKIATVTEDLADYKETNDAAVDGVLTKLTTEYTATADFSVAPDQIASTVSDSLTTAKSYADGKVAQEVLDRNSAITQKADQILQTVSETYVNSEDAATTYATQTALNQTKDAIELSASQTYSTKTELNDYKDSVADTYETKADFTVAKNAIESSVSENYTKATQYADGKVAQEVLDRNSAITQTSQQILQTVSETYVSSDDAADTYATQTALNQTKDAIELSASQTYSTKTELNTYKNSTDSAISSLQSATDTNAQDLANYILSNTQELEAIQAQVDGSIMTWFYDYPPSSDTEPTINWTTENLKNTHLGDLFYDTDTGYCYRYNLENNEYSWIQISDTDVTRALEAAAKAQDTADNKRRVFVNTPTPPYDVGDMWLQGANGDIMRCKIAKTASQSYAESDWVLASKYTDDTAVDALATTVAETYTTKADFTVETDAIKSSVDENYTRATQYADGKITEEVTNRNSAITQKADQILQTVSETYVSSDDAAATYATQTALNQTKTAIELAAGETYTKISDFNDYKDSNDDAIDDLVTSISNTYETKADFQVATDAITSTVSENLTTAKNYADGKVAQEVTDRNSAITQKANEILQTVSETYVNSEDAASTYATQTALSQTKDAIELAASQTYTTTTDFNSYKTTNDAAVTQATNYATKLYGVSTTAIDTAAKVVTCADFKLFTGATVTVRFQNGNSVTGATTLNVNSTGAKPIVYQGATNKTPNFAANTTITFTYDGTNWRLTGDGSWQAATDASTAVSNVLTKLTTEYTATSDFSVAPSEIASTVSEAVNTSKEYADGKIAQEVVDRNAAITQKAGEIELAASNTYTTKTEFNNLEIGGRNLYAVCNQTDGYIASNGNIAGMNSTYKERTSDYIPVSEGEHYILQAWVPSVDSNQNMWIGYHFYSDTTGTKVGDRVAKSGAAGATYLAYTNIVVPANATYIRVSYRQFEDGYCKLEKGTKPTDWTPAPEDTTADITSVRSSIDILSNQITSEVTAREEVDQALSELTTRVTQNSTDITTEIAARQAEINKVSEIIIGTQTAATASWTGKSNTLTELKDGTTINYWLPYAGAADVTLNLTLADNTTTGAINCYYGGATRLSTHYSAGNMIRMTYRVNANVNGTNYTGWWADGQYNTNNYDRTLWNNSIPTAGILKRYSIIGGTASGFKTLASGIEIDLEYPILYLSSSSDVAANTTTSVGYLVMPSVNLTYTKSNFSGIVGKQVCVYGTLDGNTLTIDENIFTCTVPTTEDGKVYIPIGILANTTTCYFNSTGNIPYAYKDGKFAPVAGNAQRMVDNEIEARSTIIREFAGGVLIAKVGQTIAALVNANGSFDVVGVTWNGKTPTVTDTLYARYGTATIIKNSSGDYIQLSNGNITVSGTITGATIQGGSLTGTTVTGSTIQGNTIKGGTLDIGTTDKYIKWDGSNLSIKSDSLTIAGVNAATTTNVATAKQEAINAAASDATTKANAAQTAAQTYADTAVSNLEIGGRNLLKSTGSLVPNASVGGIRHFSRTIDNLTKTTDGLKLTCTDSANICFEFPLATNGSIKNGDSLVLSFDYRGTATSNIEYFILTAPPNKPQSGLAFTVSETEWKHYEQHLTYEAPSDNTSDVRAILIAYNSNNNGKWLEIKDKSLKLEKGTKATDWTPAPEDTINAISESNTSIGQLSEIILGTQTSATGSWTGKSNYIYELTDGLSINYWLPYAGSGNATLNLTLADNTTTGAINCYYGGTTRLTTHYAAGNIIRLIYRKNANINGASYTGWWADANYDSNYYDRTWYNASVTAGEAITAGKILVGTATGTFIALKADTAFDITKPILYTSSAINNGAVSTSTYLVVPGINLTNIKSGFSGADHAMVYIVGFLNGTMFTPNSTLITTTVPTSESTLHYMLLGQMTSTTACTLLATHDIYKYHNGAFKSIIQIALEAASSASDANAAASAAQSTANANIKAVVTLFYLSNSTTAPAKPTAHVTSTSTGTGVWTTAVPTWTSTYKYFYTCNEYQYGNGTYGWSTVVYDRERSEAMNTKYTLDGLSRIENGKVLIDGGNIYINDTFTNNLFAKDITATGTIRGVNLVGSNITGGTMKVGNDEKYIEWDGSNLTIKSDNLDIGGKSAATTTDVNNAKTAVENAAKEYTDNLVNNIQIDGRNLFINTRIMLLGAASATLCRWRVAGNADMTKSRVEITDSPFGTANALQLVGTQTTTTDTSCFGIDNVPRENGADYIISMYARVFGGGTGQAGFSLYNATVNDGSHDGKWASYYTTTLDSSGKWTRVWMAFTSTAATGNVYIGGAGTNCTIQMCLIKLEKGNRLTEWTPAPEDTDALAKQANEVIQGTQTTATGSWAGKSNYIYELKDGITINYWLPYAGSGNATLNLTLADGSTTGAINCYYNGTTRLTTHYGAGNLIRLTYRVNANIDGTNYTGWWSDANYDSNSTDIVRWSYGRVIAGSNKIFPYTIIMQNADERWESIVTSSSTGKTKTRNTHGFRLETIIYHAANTTTNENAENTSWQLRTGEPAMDMRYSLNIENTDALKLIQGKSVYLVGTINATNGLFYLDEKWWSQTLPTTEDGKIYIFLGQVYDWYRCGLATIHPIYQYVNGMIKSNTQIAVEAAKAAYDNAVDLANYITSNDAALEEIQRQVDGSITTWFYAAVPTASNEPAKNWNTTDLKNTHLGDLYYDTSTGHCYRYQLSGSTYSWSIITDTDVSKALADAAKAQDTADNKRRVFVTTPVVPYDVGDLWVGGSTGDIKKCKTAKTSSQSYAAADWELASKYTDDTTANTAVNYATKIYAECTTAIGTAAKVATLSGFALFTGATVSVKFTNGNSVTGATTLNINSTGAKNIVYQGSTTTMPIFAANTVINFAYDGTYWRLVGDASWKAATDAQSTANANIKIATPLYYLSNSTTAPAKPTAHVTSTSTGTGVWTTVIPVWTSTYKYFYTCTEYQNGAGTYSWSAVVYDRERSESMESKYTLDGLKKIDGNKVLIDGSKIYVDEAFANSIFAQNITATGTISGATLSGGTVSGANLDIGNTTSYLKYSNGNLQIKANGISIGSTSVATTTDVSNAVDNLEIGGRNFLLNTGDLTTWIKEANVTVAYDSSNGMYKVTYSGSNTSRWGIYQDLTLEPNQEYTLSCEMAGVGAEIGWAFQETISGYPTSRKILSTADKIKFSTSLTSTNTAYKCRIYLCIHDAATNLNSWFNLPKLEKGNKATDWSPAPEDVTNYTDTLVNNIQIGGRNLLLDTDVNTLNATYNAYSRYLSVGSNTAITGIFVELTDPPISNIKYAYQITADGTQTATQHRGLCFYNVTGVKMRDGETYTISCWARKISGTTALDSNGNCFFQYGVSTYVTNGDDNTIITNPLTTNWQRYSWTFTYDRSRADPDATYASGGARIYFYGCNFAANTAGSYQMCGFQLENGNVLTDYSPAPEEAEIAANQATEIIQGTQTQATGTWTGVSKYINSLRDGMTINYWLPYAGSGNATLNLTLAGGGTTGAKNCYYNGTTRLTTHYGVGNLIRLTYRENVNIGGTNYTGWWSDANYYVDTIENRIPYFAGKTGTKGIWANSLFMKDSAGTYQNICTASDGTVTSSNRTTDTTKKANTNGFEVGSPIWYCTGNYNANTNISGWGNVYSSTSVIDSRYSLNTTLTAGSLTAYKPVYLVGTVKTDGLFYLDTTWWTQTPTDTSKVYVMIGSCYDSSTSYCRINLLETNGWYKYVSGKLVDYSNNLAALAQATADTAVTKADAAQSTANTANTTARANIKIATPLWYLSSSSTAPAKPTAHITQTGDVANAWTTAVPTYSATNKYFYTCTEYQNGAGTYSWSAVVYDRSKSTLAGLSKIESGKVLIDGGNIYVNDTFTNNLFANDITLTHALMSNNYNGTTSAPINNTAGTIFKMDNGTLNIGGGKIKWDGSNLSIVANSVTIGGTSAATTANVTDAVNNIEIGGRNLIVLAQMNTNDNNGDFINNNGVITDKTPTGDSRGWADQSTAQHIVTLSPGKYILSIYIDTATTASSAGYYVKNATTNTVIKNASGLDTSGFNIAGVKYLKFTIEQESIVFITLKIYTGAYRIKLEKGDKATDWTLAPEDIDANISRVEETLVSPNLTPVFSYTPYNTNNYWTSWPATAGYTFTDMGDGWIRVQKDNSSGTAIVRHDMSMQRCESVKPGTDYTFLIEFRNNNSVAGTTNDSDCYIVQNNNHQFWGNAIKKNLEGSGTGSSTSLTTNFVPGTAGVYTKRFVKTSEPTNSSYWTGTVASCFCIVFRCAAGGKIDYEVRVSLYEGEYTGGYKPYTITDTTGLGIKWNHDSFSNANNGEAYLCALDQSTNTMTDANGWVMFNGIRRIVNKGKINPDTSIPYNRTCYIVLRLSSATSITGTNYLVWYDGSAWKARTLTSTTVSAWTWANATDAVLGSFVEPSSEGAFVDCVLYNPVLTSQQVTTSNSAQLNAANAQNTANTANNRATYKYGTCTTAAATAAKVVTLSGFALYTGAQISVKFTYANTAANPTLNVNSTGAKAIYAYGAAITYPYNWSNNATVSFVYDGTNWILDDSGALSAAEIAAAQGLSLVVNGNGVFKNNTNFSSLTYDGTTSTNGSCGSFTSTANAGISSDGYFKIDPNKCYQFEFDAKTSNGLSNLYSALAFYDVDKNHIGAQNVMYIANTTTTLAQELKNGDTVVYLTDLTNWNVSTGTATYKRGFIFWNYKNSTGYTYPEHTYSRNIWSNIYTDANVNKTAKTITLTSAWSYGTFAKGTKVSQCTSGSAYSYLPVGGSVIPNTWTRYSGIYYGVDTSGNNANGKIRSGAAYANLRFLWNNNANDQTWITNIAVYEVDNALMGMSRIESGKILVEGGNIYVNDAFANRVFAQNITATGSITSPVLKTSNYNGTNNAITNTTGSIINMNAGTMNIGGKLKFDGSTLTINGNITATSGSIAGFTLASSKLYTNASQTATSTNQAGVYIGTDGINISNGTAATTTYITKTAINIGGKLTWNGTTLSVNGTVTASAGTIGGFTLSTNKLYTNSSQTKNSTTQSGVYLGTDGINISGGTAAKTVYINTDGNMNIGGKLVWNGTNLTIAAQSVTIGGTAAATTTNVTDAVNNIEIGGRNILRGTQTMTVGGGNWSTGTFRASGGTLSNVAITDAPIPNITQAIKLDSNTSTGPGFAQDGYKMQGHVGDTLVYSGWFKGVSGDTVRLQSYWTNTSGEAESAWQNVTLTSSNWEYHSVVTPAIQYNHNSISVGYIYLYPATTGNTLLVCGLKLEWGNKPTDWTPAPEDVSAYTDSAKSSAISTAASDATTKANNTLNSAKSYSDTSISNISIGGTNLLLNSGDLTKWSKESGITVTYDSTKGMYKLTYTGSNNSRYGIYQDFTLEPNQSYTLSGELAGPGSQVGWAMVSTIGWPASVTPAISNDTKVRFEKTLTTTSTNYKCRVYLAIGNTGTNKYSWFNIPKLEKGNKATGWSPAPDDTVKIEGGNIYINQAFANSIFAQNITATGTITGATLKGSTIYTGSKNSATSTANGVYIDSSGNIYAGAYNSSTGKTPFSVTSAGAITATSGSISAFSFTNTKMYTNASQTKNSTGYSGIYLGNDGLNISGGTPAKTVYINTDGSMNIGNNLKYNTTTGLELNGNLTATSGTITGVTLNGAKITGNAINISSENSFIGQTIKGTYGQLIDTLNTNAYSGIRLLHYRDIKEREGSNSIEYNESGLELISPKYNTSTDQLYTTESHLRLMYVDENNHATITLGQNGIGGTNGICLACWNSSTNTYDKPVIVRCGLESNQTYTTFTDSVVSSGTIRVIKKLGWCQVFGVFTISSTAPSSWTEILSISQVPAPQHGYAQYVTPINWASSYKRPIRIRIAGSGGLAITYGAANTEYNFSITYPIA